MADEFKDCSFFDVIINKPRRTPWKLTGDKGIGFSRKYLGFSIWKSKQKSLRPLFHSWQSRANTRIQPPPLLCHKQCGKRIKSSVLGLESLPSALVCLETQNASGYFKALCVWPPLFPLLSPSLLSFCQHSVPLNWKLFLVGLEADGDKCAHIRAKRRHDKADRETVHVALQHYIHTVH